MRDQYFASGTYGRLRMGIALRGPCFTSAERNAEDYAFARDLGLPISMHVGMAGTADAIITLQRYRMLGADVNYVHGDMLTDREFDLIAETQGTVIGDLSSIAGMWEHRRWNGSQAYSDSKLLDVVLAFAVARLWTGVLSNALEPGWVPTRMGGPGAPDDMSLAPVTQAWLAVSPDPDAMVTGGYFYHQKPRTPHPAARDFTTQDQLLRYCAALTGVTL
jgi:NAD(P)-dependent dehydrogenase (short-subunit alcohol dehydrogenase family)